MHLLLDLYIFYQTSSISTNYNIAIFTPFKTEIIKPFSNLRSLLCNNFADKVEKSNVEIEIEFAFVILLNLFITSITYIYTYKYVYMYMYKTTLAKYVWEQKQRHNITPTLKWYIVKSVLSYSNITKSCMLCLHEKFQILNYPNQDYLLNKRSELVSKCRHINK